MKKQQGESLNFSRSCFHYSVVKAEDAFYFTKCKQEAEL